MSCTENILISNIVDKIPRSKIYPKNGSVPDDDSPWRTPNLDIYYWSQNETHLYSRGRRAVPKSHVFPLTARPFQGRMVSGPRDPRSVLRHAYNKRSRSGESRSSDGLRAEVECQGNRRDYVRDVLISHRPPTVQCAQLYDRYPFVRHSRGQGGAYSRGEGGAYCKEELIIRGKVVGVFHRSASGIPVC